MNGRLSILTCTVLNFALVVSVHGQFGGESEIAFLKNILGDDRAFVANVDIQVKEWHPISKTNNSSRNITLPAKVAYDSGKLYHEIKVSDIRGEIRPTDLIEVMKSSGMDRVVGIKHFDKNFSYMVFPGIQSYYLQTNSLADGFNTNDFKQVTKLGEEVVNGHPCVKNKIVFTDNEGNKSEVTCWSATDLQDFPVKIETKMRGDEVTVHFNDIKFVKPAASLFEPPRGFARYKSQDEMIQGNMPKIKALLKKALSEDSHTKPKN